MMKTLWIMSLAGTSFFLSGCVEHVRVPLPTPLATVGGARPAVNQGLQLMAEFGDGVWGQEQERAEMAGGGFGGSVGGRFEFMVSMFESTRKVRSDSTGQKHVGSDADHYRGKLLAKRFEAQKLSLGIHLAFSESERREGTVQDEALSSIDFAVPVEFDWVSSPAEAQSPTVKEVSVYAGPRAVVQKMEDSKTGETDQGTIVGILLGLRARYSYLSLIGELNLARTPEMTLGGIRSESGLILLPMLGAKILIPLGGN